MRDDFIAVILISTHTLRKEGDLFDTNVNRHYKQFQPTPSARRVTIDQHTIISWTGNFNPHPPQGG